MLTCAKRYVDIPMAHRQPHHQGHCALIHGHNWTIELTFACHQLDQNGFVVDFGDLKYLRHWIDHHLDHACLLATDDPLREALVAAAPAAWKVYLLPNTSCEGLAQHLHQTFDPLVKQHTAQRVWVASVTVEEDSRNRATFAAPEPTSRNN